MLVSFSLSLSHLAVLIPPQVVVAHLVFRNGLDSRSGNLSPTTTPSVSITCCRSAVMRRMRRRTRRTVTQDFPAAATSMTAWTGCSLFVVNYLFVVVVQSLL